MNKTPLAPPIPKLDRRTETWLMRNWMGVVALLGSIIWQAWVGSTWVYDRQSIERELLARVVKIEAEQVHTRDVFVTQETFNLTMKNIEYRLSSIDAKLSSR
jgi:hypothetical protein